MNVGFVQNAQDRGEYKVTTEGHSHGIGGAINSSLTTHAHNISISSTGASLNASNELKEFLKDLRVVIGGQDVTPQILSRLTGWSALGDGTAQHPLCTKGTEIVDITDLIARTIGTHEIAFKVGSGGGKLVYDVFCS